MEKINPIKVLDQKDREFILTYKIGEGGQGSVYAAKGGKYVVKLVKSNKTEEDIRFNFKRIKNLNLDNLPIVRPLSLLKSPNIGYVMELANDMFPIGSLLPKGEIEGEWYLGTGGLLKRIEILLLIAKTLSELHAKALMYGDLSPANVFVSKDETNVDIRLIDSDNIRSNVKKNQIVYTPFYGDPLVVKGKALPNTYSDVWSFSILAFEILAGIHPFIGDYVNEGEQELEEKALRGEIPWVWDKDEINASSSGIPEMYIMHSSLKKNFKQCFEQGRILQIERPRMKDWVKTLSIIKSKIIKCSACTSTQFFSKELLDCLWCDTPLDKIHSSVTTRWLVGKDNKEEFKEVLKWSENENLLPTIEQSKHKDYTQKIKNKKHLKPRIYKRTFHSPIQEIELTSDDFLMEEENRIILTIQCREGKFIIIPTHDVSYYISNLKGTKTKEYTNEARLIPNTTFIHLKPLTEDQRIIIIQKDILKK